ncbi:MAG TPA: protein kinase [Pyrinomonadaceae bacterium]|nr:protein kinase [Pyrinomonadaceae bacterium]
MLTPETVLQGRYRIVRSLGQGGMGTVYEAIDERLDSTVALKETLFADERLRKQFEREARLLARVHHQALPRVSDHFSEGEGQFLVMQFIPGDDFAEKFAQRRTPFPAADVMTWADQLLDALDYLHTQEPPIIHRDIKPQNLKVTSRGQIILLDFGLAKGQASEISRVTTSASIFGYTPNYAPLEQIQGLGTDARSDLYALAATLYHLVTGVKPPDALTRAASLVNGQPDPLQAAHEVNGAVPEVLSNVLARAMAQNREQRFRNAAEMRRALHQEGLESTLTNRSEANTVLFPTAAPTPTLTDEAARATVGLGAPTKPPTIPPTGETTLVAKPYSRRSAKWAMIAVALVLLVGGAGGYYAYQKRKTAAVVALPTPSAAPSPAVTPTQPENQAAAPAGSGINSVAVDSQKVEADKQRAANDAKQVRKEKPKQKVTTTKQTDTVEVDGDNGEEFQPVQPPVPNAPNVDYSQIPNRERLRRQGITVRTLPDGSQLMTSQDGTTILTKPDGTRRIVTPPRRRRLIRP